MEALCHQYFQSPGVLENPSVGESLNVFGTFQVVKMQGNEGTVFKLPFKIMVMYGVDFFKFIQRDFVSDSPDGTRTLFEVG